MILKYTILQLAITSSIFAWRWNLPNLPSGKRSQYYLLNDDGAYKYGYDTSKGQFAKQSGDANNEVAGHYYYKDSSGNDVDVKYTAGVGGFIPKGTEKFVPQVKGPHAQTHSYSHFEPAYHSQQNSHDDQANTGDASYSFAIDTDSYKRHESSDASGNVQGRYSYSNEAGTHDLSYIAGSNSGFVATSGSLSRPNGLAGKNIPSTYSRTSIQSANYNPVVPNVDGSYSFGYTTGDSSRQESSDASGNVQGRYSYSNEAGTHDLSYVAGSSTGFQPTGGSLAQPNGITGKIVQTYSTLPLTHATSYTPTIPNQDGSYSFDYTTGDSSRRESSDASGNVQGRYSFTNAAGTHDLSYVAGSATGFQPTGGSLATYSTKTISHEPASFSPVIPNPDGSYSFAYSTDDSSRQESSDASGNVQGRYSFTNEAGTHDLSYVAGSATGFQPTGGNLAVPSAQIATSHTSASVANTYLPPAPSSDADESNTGDASYSFTVDTDDYKRQESSDAQGNVKGSFSYKDHAGSHDLSFVAGSETGFLPTGGSLSQPNGIISKSVVTKEYLPPAAFASESQDDESNTGDASYSFTIDTDEYKRQESSDASGNVKGSYSYKNAAGSHDLSYIAGSNTGFQVTSGSLSQPNGLEGKSVPLPVATIYHTPHFSGPQADESNTGDASYSFEIDTAEYKRKESSDSQGNIQGTYSYKNTAGTHDLSYTAGAETGFITKSGSLSIPNGNSGTQISSIGYLPPQANIFSSDQAKSFREDKIGNLLVKNYYPSKSQSKYGYIFEST